jgi:geranylgeranyl pyrophosphate synthase
MQDASALAAAVEVVHAYSLVHDDLPCMDDDDLRRGRPTTHKAFSVPIATAVGLAMIPLAVRAAWRAAQTLGAEAVRRRAMVQRLMRASGATGMVGGQLLDLEAEGRVISLPELEAIHRGKTGALIACAAVLGGQAAGATDGQLEALETFGDRIGLAFQIADDVLDVTASSEQLGKTAQRDLALQKSTYVSLLGVAGAQARAVSLAREACVGLRSAGLDSPELEALSAFVVDRHS